MENVMSYNFRGVMKSTSGGTSHCYTSGETLSECKLAIADLEGASNFAGWVEYEITDPDGNVVGGGWHLDLLLREVGLSYSWLSILIWIIRLEYMANMKVSDLCFCLFTPEYQFFLRFFASTQKKLEVARGIGTRTLKDYDGQCEQLLKIKEYLDL
jgi:hypothetical protein